MKKTLARAKTSNYYDVWEKWAKEFDENGDPVGSAFRSGGSEYDLADTTTSRRPPAIDPSNLNVSFGKPLTEEEFRRRKESGEIDPARVLVRETVGDARVRGDENNPMTGTCPPEERRPVPDAAAKTKWADVTDEEEEEEDDDEYADREAIVDI